MTKSAKRISARLVTAVKRNSTGGHKPRLETPFCANGITQQIRIRHTYPFLSTGHCQSLRQFVVSGLYSDFEGKRFDVSSVFLYSETREPGQMRLPREAWLPGTSLEKSFGALLRIAGFMPCHRSYAPVSVKFTSRKLLFSMEAPPSASTESSFNLL